MAAEVVRCVDGGGIPYVVEIDRARGEARVWLNALRDGSAPIDVRHHPDQIAVHHRLWRSFAITDAWVGYDPSESGLGRRWWAGGSAVLLRVRGGGDYVYVGECVRRLALPEPVLSFQAAMGAGFVTYPSITTASRKYAMLECAWVHSGELDPYEAIYSGRVRGTPFASELLHGGKAYASRHQKRATSWKTGRA